LPQAVYVALSRTQAVAPQFAGRTIGVADWYVRLAGGEPERIINETYSIMSFDSAGKVEASGAGADGQRPQSSARR